jgi:hypothetical protein
VRRQGLVEASDPLEARAARHDGDVAREVAVELAAQWIVGPARIPRRGW